MALPEFTSRVGGVYSQFGLIALGGDPLNEVVVIWIRNAHSNDNSIEIDFGYDEGGQPVKLFHNVPTVLTRAQAQQAQNDGAILVVLGNV